MTSRGKSRTVVVTGIGVISSLGTNPGDVHAALVEGKSGRREISLFKTDELAVREACEIDFVPQDFLGRKRNIRPIDRSGQLSIIAAKLALEAGGLDEEARHDQEVCLVLGTMFGSVRTIAEFDRRAVEAGPKYAKPFEFANSVINAAAGQTAIWHGLRGTNSTVAGGAAAGLKALAYATDMIRDGRATVALAGGAEELCFESFYGYHQAGLLAGTHSQEPRAVPFAAARNGFCLGEGSAIFVLEEAEAAAARGATAIAAVRGHAASFDPSRGGDVASAAAAVERSVRLAFADAGVEAAEIDVVAAGANGGPGDGHEATALGRVFGERAAELPVMAVKGQLGECLGASGAFQVMTLVEAMRRGEVPGIAGLNGVGEGFPLALASPKSRRAEMRHGLAHASSFEGSACALIMERMGRQSG